MFVYFSYLAVFYFLPCLPLSPLFHSLHLPPFPFVGHFSFLLCFLPSLFPSQPTKREGPLIDLPQLSCPSTPPSPPPLLPSLAHSSFSQPAPDKKGAEVFLFGHIWNWSHQRRMRGNKKTLFFLFSFIPGHLRSIWVIFHLNAALNFSYSHLAFKCLFHVSLDSHYRSSLFTLFFCPQPLFQPCLPT